MMLVLKVYWYPVPAPWVIDYLVTKSSSYNRSIKM